VLEALGFVRGLVGQLQSIHNETTLVRLFSHGNSLPSITTTALMREIDSQDVAPCQTLIVRPTFDSKIV